MMCKIDFVFDANNVDSLPGYWELIKDILYKMDCDVYAGNSITASTPGKVSWTVFVRMNAPHCIQSAFIRRFKKRLYDARISCRFYLVWLRVNSGKGDRYTVRC